MDTKSATIAISSAALAAVATYFLLGKQKKVRAADYPEFQTKLAAVLARLAEIKVVPVVAIDDAADAVPLARALVDGGLPCAEITFRTAAAEDAIRAVAQANLPGMLIGAGTVLDVDQAQRAVAAGAHFLVAPGFNLEVVEWAIRNNVPIVPGVVTPSEVEAALSVGITTCKFFPAGSMGGLSTLKSISAPYGMMKFMPTGGVSTANIKEYLSFKKIVCCGGSWMVKPTMVAEKKFAEITQLASAAVELANSA